MQHTRDPRAAEVRRHARRRRAPEPSRARGRSARCHCHTFSRIVSSCLKDGLITGASVLGEGFFFMRHGDQRTQKSTSLHQSVASTSTSTSTLPVNSRANSTRTPYHLAVTQIQQAGILLEKLLHAQKEHIHHVYDSQTCCFHPAIDAGRGDSSDGLQTSNHGMRPQTQRAAPSCMMNIRHRRLAAPCGGVC